MKRLLTGIFIALYAVIASATTLNPIQLLNPAGSTSGQAIVSTGASTAPAWGGVGLNGIAAIAANTVLANATGSSASPTAFAMPSCSTSSSALNWTSGTGATCNTTINAATLGGATLATVQTGELLNVRVFASGATYTPTAGTNSIVVYVVGAGGGSGGNAATGAGQNAASGGGGAGAFEWARITSAFSGVTLAVGTGGTAGAAGANAGGTGGTTSFGALISCTGGVGGGGGAAVASASAGGSAGTGAAACTISGVSSLINTAGQSGTSGQIVVISGFVQGGSGGSTLLGLAGPLNGGTSPIAGIGFGSGAAGMISLASASAAAGAAGAGGVIIIFEYR